MGSVIQPQTVTWFKVYCAVLAAMYFAVLLMGVAFFFIPPHELDMQREEALLSGGMMVLMALPFLLASLLPLLMQPRPWLWVYDLVLICLGMTSCCLLPFAIPLLIYWIKPETKAFFAEE